MRMLGVLHWHCSAKHTYLHTKRQDWNVIQTLKTRLEYDSNTKKARLEYDPNTKNKAGI